MEKMTKDQNQNNGKQNNVILEILQRYNNVIQEILQRLAIVETKFEGVASKEDIATLATRLTKVETKFEGVATKEDIADLEKNMGALETRIHRTLMWAMSIMVTILGVMVAIVGGIAIKLFFF